MITEELFLTLLIIGTLGAILSAVVVPTATWLSDNMDDQPDLLDWTPPQGIVENSHNQDFDGSTYEEARDRIRLREQLDRVYTLMLDGKSRTLKRISELTGDPEPSVSARLRDLRKPKFGGHTVIREQVKDENGKNIDGLYAYQLVVPEQEKAA